MLHSSLLQNPLVTPWFVSEPQCLPISMRLSRTWSRDFPLAWKSNFGIPTYLEEIYMNRSVQRFARGIDNYHETSNLVRSVKL